MKIINLSSLNPWLTNFSHLLIETFALYSLQTWILQQRIKLLYYWPQKELQIIIDSHYQLHYASDYIPRSDYNEWNSIFLLRVWWPHVIVIIGRKHRWQNCCSLSLNFKEFHKNCSSLTPIFWPFLLSLFTSPTFGVIVLLYNSIVQ